MKKIKKKNHNLKNESIKGGKERSSVGASDDNDNSGSSGGGGGDSIETKEKLVYDNKKFIWIMRTIPPLSIGQALLCTYSGYAVLFYGSSALTDSTRLGIALATSGKKKKRRKEKVGKLRRKEG